MVKIKENVEINLLDLGDAKSGKSEMNRISGEILCSDCVFFFGFPEFFWQSV